LTPFSGPRRFIMPKAHPVLPSSFEAALGELESIVQSMESSPLTLEASLAAYQRGVGLLKHCQEALADAERKIQILENGDLRDFNPDDAEQTRKTAS
jgi:exodeoxyribonuclease VII small subunit